ncbi:hypothetical protein ACHAW5_010136 [Stephanodiscus triporus]|uniref:Major facilitator superfamily (MFS) profile domain-containing protein n=1 Tax=Stephanodiscus triporus TaxID=2934178 RepID=A0ABD3MVN9_9STRA
MASYSYVFPPPEYDFALFGFFSDVIATVFFPPPSDDDYDNNDGGSSRLIASFALYGGAFVMRPLGGLIIGRIGDRHGRKRALVLSLSLMAFPTFFVGCLPTYEQVGPLSTILLLICRLLQGISVGGQLPASLIYTVEMSPKEHWGYYGSLVMMSANIGTLLGSFVGVFIRLMLTDEQLVEWGWRLPFLSGILIAFVSMYLDAHGKEHNPNVGGRIVDNDNDESDTKKGESNHSLGEVFKRENLPALASATLTPMLYGAGFYTTFVWMAIFMEVLVDPPINHGFEISSMALLFGIVLPLPLAGMLSDRWGREKTMAVGAMGLGILGPFMLNIISSGDEVKAFFAQWTIGIFLVLFGGPMNAWLVEKFPAKIRLTSAAFGYDLAHCTASAFSPMVATLLVQQYGVKAPGFIYPFFAVLSLIGMLLSTDIHRCGGIDYIDDNYENEFQLAEGVKSGANPHMRPGDGMTRSVGGVVS